MSIHILLGKPGSGKSLYGTNRVLNELRETRRNIVTNLPLRLDALNEYVQKRWPQDNFCAVSRIRILTDDEMREFWTIRGDNDGKDGVAYFLDEAHIAFNAREWATLGKGALHYLSQHRKLGDIVWVITQAPGNLDKQFRSVAEDFTVLRNEYTAKWGPFKGRGRFVRKSYLSEPQSNSEPFETASFSLDGVAECYDTAKGIGVHGAKADIGRRAKGIPILWVIPAFLVLALSCVAIPWALGKGMGSFLGNKVDDVREKAAEVVPSSKNPAPVSVAEPDHVPRIPEVDTRTVWMTGYIRSGRRINVTLSDGRTLTESDDLKRVERNFAEMQDGRRYYLRSSGNQIDKPVQPNRRDPQDVTQVTRVPEVEGGKGYAGEALFPASASVSELSRSAVSAQSVRPAFAR